jgi:hypothetical protein
MDDHTRDPNVAPPLGNPTGWCHDRREWGHATLRRATERDARPFDAGEYHASLENVRVSVNSS